MEKEAVIVVFGCRYQEEFLARIDAARHFAMRNNINPIFIFTGFDSPPPKEVIDVFKTDRIIWENVSLTTEENIQNTFEWIERNWFVNSLVSNTQIYFASSWYHIRRIKMLLQLKGAKFDNRHFIMSYRNIRLINVLVEPFALLAAKFRINKYPLFTRIKRIIGYNV